MPRVHRALIPGWHLPPLTLRPLGLSASRGRGQDPGATAGTRWLQACETAPVSPPSPLFPAVPPVPTQRSSTTGSPTSATRWTWTETRVTRAPRAPPAAGVVAGSSRSTRPLARLTAAVAPACEASRQTLGPQSPGGCRWTSPGAPRPCVGRRHPAAPAPARGAMAQTVAAEAGARGRPRTGETVSVCPASPQQGQCCGAGVTGTDPPAGPGARAHDSHVAPQFPSVA